MRPLGAHRGALVQKLALTHAVRAAEAPLIRVEMSTVKREPEAAQTAASVPLSDMLGAAAVHMEVGAIQVARAGCGFT